MSIGIGANSWIWTSPFTDDSAPLIDHAAAMGFDVFEIPVEDPDHFGGQRIAEALKRTGLRPTVCGAFGPTRDLTHDEPKYREESLRYLARAVKLCEGWHAKILAGPMYSAVGKRRQIPADQKRREWERAVKGLGEAARMAADHGVTLAIEPLNRFETDLINTAAQGRQMICDVGRPNLKLHLDTFHMGIEETSVLDAITLAGPDLVHFHACENNRGAPGSGLVPWAQVQQGLKAIGYDGAAVIESFTPECLTIAAAAAIWRPLATSQDALAREGLAFLRQLLG